MGTMRNNFAAVFVSLILMFSTSQSRSLHGNENSSKRNNFPDALGRDSGSTSASIYECLFVDQNLPICDVEWMLDSKEDSIRNQNFFNGDVEQRSRRNVDTSAMDVVIYTIEGCLPSRLPFVMPSCDGISVDRVIDIQTFRPFVVKGVTKPPLVFPKFNYPRWLHMMTRLRNHVLLQARDDKQHASATKEASTNESIYGRKEELMNAATTKETMPNVITANKNSSKGSSSNRLIPSDSSKYIENIPVDKIRETGQDAFNGKKTKASSPRENTILQYYGKANSMKLWPKKRGDRSRPKASVQGSHEIRTIPVIPKEELSYDRSTMEQPLNQFSSFDNSQKFLKLSPNVDVTDNGIAYDFPLTEEIVEAFRRRREISTQGIAEESKEHGTSYKSISRDPHTEEESSYGTNRFSVSRKEQKQFKSLTIDQQGIATADDVQNIAIPGYSPESDLASQNNDSHGKIDVLDGPKATSRKAASKETPSSKNYRSHRESPSSRSQ